MTIRLGTRGSALALAQTELAASALRLRGFDVHIVIVHTRGDADPSSPLSEIGRGGGLPRHVLRLCVLRGGA